jgi:hypothetical protein
MTSKFQPLLDAVNEGQAVLVSSAEYGLPTIHDVGHSLQTSGEVEHCGFGWFIAPVLGSSVTFDGGGAMLRSSNISWTPLRVANQDQLDFMGYDIDEVKTTLEKLIAEDI